VSELIISFFILFIFFFRFPLIVSMVALVACTLFNRDTRTLRKFDIFILFFCSSNDPGAAVLNLPVAEMTRLLAERNIPSTDAKAIANAMAVSKHVSFENFFQFVRRHRMPIDLEHREQAHHIHPTLSAIQTAASTFITLGASILDPDAQIGTMALEKILHEM
jgi:hypothetical protein